MRCSYEFGLADLLREWNQLEAANEHVMKGIEYRRRFGGYLLIGDLALMRILQAQGDVEGAMKALRDAEQAVETYPFQMALMIEFRASGVIQWLAAGDVLAASRWAKECGGSEQEQIALARVLLAQGRAADAQRLLIRQQPLAEAGGRTGRLIEILSLLAIALEAQGVSAEADVALSQALSLARPEGYRRVFLGLGQPLYELLERLAAREGATKNQDAHIASYVRDLLDAFQQERQVEAVSLPPSHAETISDPLTEREIDVLRLLSEGLSNKEIANRLTVAPSTIKQHLKNIFGKIDAHSRTQAVAARAGTQAALVFSDQNPPNILQGIPQMGNDAPQ